MTDRIRIKLEALAIAGEAKLSTGYVSIHLFPTIVTDCSPLLVHTYFHTTTVVIRTVGSNEHDLSILANS